ncbi:MAG TPA: hypothetical protein VF137_09905 [Candidatus Dormibacteraeota bacterium]
MLAGSVLLVHARAAVGPHSPSGLPLDWDFRPAFDACRAILTGTALPTNSQAYPLPYELVFIPLSLGSAAFAQVSSALVTAILLVAALLVWQGLDGIRRPGFWVALLSLPAVEVVQGDHPFSVLGLLAVGVALRAEHGRRWVIMGLAAALSLIRPFNAIPVLIGLLRTMPRRAWAPAAAGFAGLGAILLGLSFLVDRIWVSQYETISSAYGWAGLIQPLVLHFGVGALLALEAAVALLGLALARRGPEGPMDMDRAAGIMAITVFVTPLAGLYVGIFALPALARLADRRETCLIAFVTSGLAWLAVLLLARSLLGPNPRLVLAELGALVYWFGLNAYPLFRARVAPAA